MGYRLGEQKKNPKLRRRVLACLNQLNLLSLSRRARSYVLEQRIHHIYTLVPQARWSFTFASLA